MNVVLKLLTKVLARRLTGVMDHLVSDSQSAFIKKRQMSDCILLTSEVFEALAARKSKGVILKIDFEKAFDTVCWDFLFEVLEQMNFDDKWIDWIKSIFESSKISVLVNGVATDEFCPKQGLRQGCPLSPLLFNLIGEVLSKMLDRTNSSGIFAGVNLVNCQQPISHLQFADDVILFIRNDLSSIKGVKQVLQCFQLMSGLSINF